MLFHQSFKALKIIQRSQHIRLKKFGAERVLLPAGGETKMSAAHLSNNMVVCGELLRLAQQRRLHTERRARLVQEAGPASRYLNAAGWRHGDFA
jgi:hypothetical protein